MSEAVPGSRHRYGATGGGEGRTYRCPAAGSRCSARPTEHCSRVAERRSRHGGERVRVGTGRATAGAPVAVINEQLRGTPYQLTKRAMN